MGNFCSGPQGLNGAGSERGGRLDLMEQLSYDIYKIEGDADWREDFDVEKLSRRNSKRYYEVRKSPISRMHSQVSSYWPGSPAGTSATKFLNWTRNQQPSSMELTNSLEELVHAQRRSQTDPSTPSSPESESSSGSSTFELDPSHHHSPSTELELEERARVEKAD